ncbi:hypothetical protein P7C70_g6625, partial [Phenoliferia sp. Uapishka_3]
MASSSIPAPTSSPFAAPLGLSLDGLSDKFTNINFSLTPSTIASSALVLIVTLLLAEQSLWRWRKGNLPGWKWQIPIIGQFADSLHPSMQAYKKRGALIVELAIAWSTPFQAVSVFNIFIVMTSGTDVARRILNASASAEPCLVRSAKQVLLRLTAAENWVFLNGKIHNEYRKGLNCLFTRRALAIYLKVQDRINRQCFNRWMSDPSPAHKPYQMIFRDLNMETSLRVFCGNYVRDENVQEISDKYWLITRALELVNFPFAFPGTKVWSACRARSQTVGYLIDAAAESKKQMAAGKEPDCLLDEWVSEILAAKAYRERKDDTIEKPNLILREYTNKEMALVLLSFIFASQDAMSSSITFAFQLLADHPEVFKKVREEQDRIRSGDRDSAVAMEWLEDGLYTNAVTTEILRLRPPVIMVPYMTTKPFQVTEDYTVPKGTMLIPSFWNSLHDPAVYPDPDEFIPERWLPGGSNAGPPTASKNWLGFGHGAHRCIAQDFVFMEMNAIMGSAA